MIRLVIVSDIKLYREGLAETLTSRESLCVRSSVSNEIQAIEEIQTNSPDVVLIDMTMVSCLESVSRIATACPTTKIIAIAVTDDEDTILACARAGMAGYVSRDASIEQLISTIHGVVNGELYCPRKLAAALFHKIESLHNNVVAEPNEEIDSSSSSDKLALLTQREQQVARYLTSGLSNKQIARTLSIEISTVKNHVHNILVKMGVGSRMQAANILFQQQGSR